MAVDDGAEPGTRPAGPVRPGFAGRGIGGKAHPLRKFGPQLVAGHPRRAAAAALAAATVAAPPPPSEEAEAEVAVARLPLAEPARLQLRHQGLILSFLALVCLPVLVTALYLGFIAEDRYASTVGFTVRREDATSASSLLGGCHNWPVRAAIRKPIFFTNISAVRKSSAPSTNGWGWGRSMPNTGRAIRSLRFGPMPRPKICAITGNAWSASPMIPVRN